MQYKTTIRISVSGKHKLEDLKDRLRDIVMLDLEEQDDDYSVDALEIDWDSLEKESCRKKKCKT